MRGRRPWRGGTRFRRPHQHRRSPRAAAMHSIRPESSGAPGAPRALGQPGRRADVGEAPEYRGRPAGTLPGGAPQIATNEEGGVGVPGGRPAGSPLDLSTMSNAAVNDPESPRRRQHRAIQAPLARPRLCRQRRARATSTISATAICSARITPRRSRRCELSCRNIPMIGSPPKPNSGLAKACTSVRITATPRLRSWTCRKSTNLHPKAPNALLRLGESLAALQEHELACATLGEVARKYPKASNGVKQAAEREQKRAGC